MADIKFELRKRNKIKHDFWAIEYNDNGDIQKLSAGQQTDNPMAINVTFKKIEKLLNGKDSQSNYIVAMNDKIGALDLIDKRTLNKYKLSTNQEWQWLSVTMHETTNTPELRFILFTKTGVVRLEPSRRWATSVAEQKLTKPLTLYITDATDPHLFLGNVDIQLNALVEQGYAEFSLWNIIEHDIAQRILWHGLDIRLNLPRVAKGILFLKTEEYYAFNGTIDLQTVLSHPGPGVHITLYAKGNKLWAQSHYTSGCAIDQLEGDITGAIIKGNDPDNFVAWVQLPALMLRQNAPFEVLPEWQDNTVPNLLYKANNLDIGVAV
jgi:hypothetical protein